MKARSWFFGFLFLIIVFLITFLPFQNKFPIQKNGSFANHLVSVYSIKTKDSKKLNTSDFEDAFKETKERVASELQISSHRDNTFKIFEIQESSKSQQLEEFLSKKSTFIMTDEEGNPLFFKGVFNKKTLDFFLNSGFREEEFRVPIGPTSAKYRFETLTNKHVIDLEGQSPAADYELTKAKLDALKNRQKIYFWIDYKKFILQAQEEDIFEWVKSGRNPIKYAINQDNNFENNSSLFGTGFESYLDLLEAANTKSAAKPFLIGSIRVNKVNANTAFSISASFSSQRAKSIAATINYGNANYSIKKDYSYIEEASPYLEASISSLWILLILFLSFVFYLILNYRILGFVFSLFFGMAIVSAFNFTTSALNGYSQIVFVVLMFSLISLATNIVNLFETFRVEFARFLALDRAWIISSKRSLNFWFLANIILAICSSLLFYSRYPMLSQLGFALLVSQAGIGIFGVLMPRLFFLLFLKSFFDFNHWWLGLQRKRGADSTLFFRFLKHKFSPKLQVFARLIQNLLVVGLFITLLVFYFRSEQTTLVGFALDPKDSFEELVVISSTPFKALSTTQLQNLNSLISSSGFDSINLETKLASETPKAYVALLTSQNSQQILELKNLLSTNPSFETILYSQSTQLDSDFHKNIYLIFLVFFAIQLVFSILVWRLSFGFTLLSSSCQAIFAFLAPLAFSRVFITSETVIYLVIAFLLYNQNSIMSLARIRLHVNALVGFSSNVIIGKREILNSARLAGLETVKPRVISSALILEIVFLNFLFGWESLSILSWVGIWLAITITGIGLLSRIYTSFIELQNQLKHQRLSSNFWEIQNPVEQTFPGINDFNY